MGGVVELPQEVAHKVLKQNNLVVELEESGLVGIYQRLQSS